MTNFNLPHDFIRNTFGFNPTVFQLERIKQKQQAFPPYSIYADVYEDPSKYLLQIAVAGFSKEEITTKIIKERGVTLLVIEGQKLPVKADDQLAEYSAVICAGLAFRNFKREFTLSSMKVDNVSLENGILSIKISSDEIKKDETLLKIE